jgi:hypothetical protein
VIEVPGLPGPERTVSQILVRRHREHLDIGDDGLAKRGLQRRAREPDAGDDVALPSNPRAGESQNRAVESRKSRGRLAARVNSRGSAGSARGGIAGCQR